MKTISSRFLKASLAMLLVVLMLFSSTISGFAAVVDKAETSANTVAGGYVYFDNTKTKWTDSCIQFVIGHSSFSRTYTMSKITNTNIYYVNLSASTYHDWGDATYYAVIGTSSKWGDGNWGSSNLTNATHRTAAYTTAYNMDGDTKRHLVTPTGSSNGTAIKIEYQGTTFGSVNKTNYVYVKSAAAGSTTYNDSSSAGTAKITGYYLSNNNVASSHSATTTLNSTYTANCTIAPGTTITLEATANTGYKFVGWYTSSGTLVSDAASCTTAFAGSTTYHARFQQAGYAFTVTAGTGGTASPASGTAQSVDITATPNDGYKFDGWEVTGGSVADTSDPTTTFTITAANANAHATFAPEDYTVTLNANGGTINSGDVKGYTFGDTVTLPTDVTRTGYTFKGWKDDATGSTVTSITSTTFGDKTYTAQWQINTYTITVNQNAGGTTKVGSTTISGTTGTAKFDYGTSVTVVVTPSTNYKINSISGAVSSEESLTAVTKTFTVEEDATINVDFAPAGSCSVHFAKGNGTQELVIGGTYENTATTDATYCDGDGTVTYSSNDTSVATVDADGVVTAVKPGKATITATCNTDTSAQASYEVHVLAPSLTFEAITLDVNGEADADKFWTLENVPNKNYSVTYTAITSGDVRVAADGTITAMGPTTGVNVTAKITCGSWSDTVTFPVAVNTPALNFNPKAVNLIVGQTMTEAFAASATAGNPTITIKSDNDSVITIGADNKGTAKGAGSTTVTATFTFNDYYKPVATANVLVAAPTIKANPTSVALEFGEGATATSKTVTVETNAEAGNGTGDTVTVESADDSVATATLSGSTITITAKAVGSTTVTAKFHDAVVEIPVTVTQYDPYVYLYITNNQDFTNLYLYSWQKANNNKVVTAVNTKMVYIGVNGDGDKIFAYRFEKTNKPDHFIITKTGNWTGNWQTADIPVSWDTTDHKAFYFTNANNKTTMGDWTKDCMIVRPTVSVADVVVPVGGTETATATVTDGGNVLWKSQGTSIATIADVATQTSTVTGVTPGNTTITARAFVDTTKSSIKTLPTNYKTDTACWPFISTEATANVTVGSVDYDVAVSAKYSNDGTTYTSGTVGGTVSATIDGVEQGEEFKIAHGKSFNLEAKPAEGYRFLGWSIDGKEVGDYNPNPVDVTVYSNKSYVAHFVKTYKVSVNLAEGIELVKFNNISSAEGFTDVEVDAGASITVYASPKEGFNFKDWTVEGATVADNTRVNLVVENVQSDITLTANAVPTYTATAIPQTNKYFGNYGGTVTINGNSSPQQFLAGANVEFEATPKANYYFDGWYKDAEFTERVSEDLVYEEEMTEKGITLYALFVKHFYIEGAMVGAEKVELVYDIATNSYSGTSNGYTGNAFLVKDKTGSNVTAADINVTGGSHTGATVTGNANGYTLVPDLENYAPTAPISYTLTPDLKADGTADGTYTLNIKLAEAKKVAISVKGEKVADKVIGTTFSHTFTAPGGMYLESVTTTPAVDVTIVDNTVTFTVPDEDVNIVPAFAEYSYIEFTDATGLTITGLKTGYKAGEPVEITVAPASAQVSISDIKADNEAVVLKDNGTDWTITIAAMPADTTITLTTTVDAKFKMDYGTVAIGNYGSGYTTYGTVAMKVGSTALAKGGYADKTETVTYTATPNTNFIFDGWYSDSECSTSALVSRETSCDVTPTKDTTLYALFVPKHYIAEDQAVVTTNKEMTYDPATRTFHHVTSTMAKGAWFRVSNNKTTSAWTDSNSYCVFDSSFNVTFNANSYMVSVGWGTQCYALNSDSSAEYPYDIVVEIHGNSSIDVSCKANKTGNTIWLSSGRLDLPGSYNAAVFEATSKFTHEGATNPSDVYVANEGENREKYKKLNLPEAQTISFETEITGTAAGNYEVYRYVVYHILTETYTIVVPNTLGNNKYSGSVYADGDCYIVPIYFLTEAYAEANNLAEIDIYFDATAIKDQQWGPFVACYAWGSNNAEYAGGWSGQMMIPSEDGLSFYAMITVPKHTDTNAPSVPHGVTFNNYTQSTVPGSNAGAFGISATQYQCYDYREPITLYEAGYEVITFVAKDSTDGYHGDRANGVTANTITSTTTDIFNKYHFDYLYDRDSKNPIDFNGDVIENPVDIKVAKADYYVITKGDITYDPNGTKYEGNTSFDADWAVDWYVFDKNGKYITNILSTALYHDHDGNGTTLLLEKLGLTSEDAAGKTVAISYEHENNAGHQVSYDGQWYGNMLDHTMTGDVFVGIVDANNNVKEIDDDNIADYGKAYVVDENGDKHQTLEISMDSGEINLNAVTEDGYRFIGWHTLQPDGSYKYISNAFDYSTLINLSTTYYALFKEIGHGEVVINHMVYKNNDPVIPSHDGVSEMSIEVVLPDGTVQKSTPSTSRSTITFDGEDTKTYKIRILTKPMMNGEFYAWYTDSETADGTNTYEEVFTGEGQINSKQQIVAEFEYTYDKANSQKTINIYSDVKRVSNYAMFQYKYRNRENQIRIYTVKGVLLTDEECTGFAGNDGKTYCPAYKTLYTFADSNGNEYEAYEGTDSYNNYVSKGYQVVDTFNKISYYAPNPDVTEVFNGTVSWDIDSATVKAETGVINVTADQGDCEYTINYTMGDVTDSISGPYNDLAKITAPTTFKGQTFSYWYEPATGEILTYSQFYNYRIVENKTIIAVYGEDVKQEWTPSINSVTYTREFGDDGDFIYTDYLLAFNNKDGKELNKVYAEDNSYEYGLLLVRDASYYISDKNNIKYTDTSNAYIENYLKRVAGEKKKNMAFTVDGVTYNCNYYNLSGKTLTNFNRMDYYLKYDNNAVVNTNHYYREYAYTAVAYIIVNGEVYLSTPKNVNFFDLGNLPPTIVTN